MSSENDQFQRVADLDALRALIARSHDKPVVVFKHSNACGVSASAYREMARVEGDVAIVVVQESRDVSREIETRTGIRHESPQAMILRDGKVVWSASHFAVTADAVIQALAETT